MNRGLEKDSILNFRPLRNYKFFFLFISAILLSVSCSKESAADNEQDIPQTDGLGTEKPDVGKAEADKANRAKAKQLYTDYYVSLHASTSDLSWTGNEPSCDAGSVPQATKDKIFMRLSYFRKAVGLNNEITENSSKSEKAQKAALMMHANGTLDHFSPNDWKCFSTDGKEGAGNSLLTSTKNAAAIDSYIRDQGSDNYPVGHRRWLLWPRLHRK